MLIRAYADCIMTTRGAIRASPDARTEGGAHILARPDELSAEICGVWTEAPSRLADLARFAACQRAHINEIDVARPPHNAIPISSLRHWLAHKRMEDRQVMVEIHARLAVLRQIPAQSSPHHAHGTRVVLVEFDYLETGFLELCPVKRRSTIGPWNEWFV